MREPDCFPIPLKHDLSIILIYFLVSFLIFFYVLWKVINYLSFLNQATPLFSLLFVQHAKKTLIIPSTSWLYIEWLGNINFDSIPMVFEAGLCFSSMHLQFLQVFSHLLHQGTKITSVKNLCSDFYFPYSCWLFNWFKIQQNLFW